MGVFASLCSSCPLSLPLWLRFSCILLAFAFSIAVAGTATDARATAAATTTTATTTTTTKTTTTTTTTRRMAAAARAAHVKGSWRRLRVGMEEDAAAAAAVVVKRCGTLSWTPSGGEGRTRRPRQWRNAAFAAASAVTKGEVHERCGHSWAPLSSLSLSSTLSSSLSLPLSLSLSLPLPTTSLLTALAAGMGTTRLRRPLRLVPESKPHVLSSSESEPSQSESSHAAGEPVVASAVDVDDGHGGNDYDNDSDNDNNNDNDNDNDNDENNNDIGGENDFAETPTTRGGRARTGGYKDNGHDESSMGRGRNQNDNRHGENKRDGGRGRSRGRWSGGRNGGIGRGNSVGESGNIGARRMGRGRGRTRERGRGRGGQREREYGQDTGRVRAAFGGSSTTVTTTTSSIATFGDDITDDDSTNYQAANAERKRRWLLQEQNMRFAIEEKLAELRESDAIAEKEGVKLAQSYCDSILGLCVAADEWESVLEVLDVMKRNNLVQQRSSYEACLSECVHVGNGNAAMEILNAMELAQFVPTAKDVASVVLALCRIGGGYDYSYGGARKSRMGGGGGGGNKNKSGGEGGRINSVVVQETKNSSWRKGLALLQKAADTAAKNDTARRETREEEKAKEEMGETKGDGDVAADMKYVDPAADVVDVEAYNAVLHRMKDEGRWKEALQLLHLMQQSASENKRKMTTQRMMNTRIGIGRKEKGAKEAALFGDVPTDDDIGDDDGNPDGRSDGAVVISKPEEFHAEPNLATYHAVLGCCAESGQAEQAVQLLLSLPQRGIKPISYTFELVVTGLLKKRQWRRALHLLDAMDEMSVPQSTVIYNTVISACAKAKEVGSAMNLFAKMRRRGIKPDVVTFNALMSACAGTPRWKDALSLLDQCNREPGVEPDIITYTNAMRACATGKKTKRALSLLEVVKDKGIKPDAYCYTAVIDACAKGNMWRKALDLLDEMRKNGIYPNAVTYSVAIAACGNGGQWERALELLHQMREKGLKVNTITYNAAITALAKAARMNSKEASRLTAPRKYQALSAGGEMSPEEISQFLGGEIDEVQLWTRALELLDQMKGDGVEPDTYSYSAAISACGSGGRWEEALELMSIMQKGGPKTRPNRIAYTAAIAACGKCGEWEHAVQLFDDMRKEGLQPDRVAYNALVSALRVAGQADKVYEVWKEMCGEEQSDPGAIALARADSKSVSPDIITVTDVLATLDRAKKSNREMIDAVFNEAVRRGVILPSDSMDTLWEVDMSGFSLPVAHAACHFLVKRVVEAVGTGETECADLTLITGVGRMQSRASGNDEPAPKDFVSEEEEREAGGGGGNGSDDDNDDDDASPKPRRSMGTTALREYVREILRDDFDPPLYSVVPPYAKGTVQVTRTVLQKYIDAQG